MTHDRNATSPTGNAVLTLDVPGVPGPDRLAEPEGFTVTVDSADRIHFLDWGGPGPRAPGILAIHGLAQTAWAWTPVARRLAGIRRFVAMDLRGHGLSDAPTHGYDLATLAEDVGLVAESTLLEDARDASVGGVILAGHGFGACVAAWAARRLGELCRGLVLVDGGLQDFAATTEMDPDEFLRATEEPPEVLRSMTAFLADRAGFDTASWDADQERAARETVVEVPAGRVIPATRPHVVAGCVEAMFAYRPGEAIAGLALPVVALRADGGPGDTWSSLVDVQRARVEAGLPPIREAIVPAPGHNLMRYRPTEVAAAILAASA